MNELKELKELKELNKHRRSAHPGYVEICERGDYYRELTETISGASNFFGECVELFYEFPFWTVVRVFKVNCPFYTTEQIINLLSDYRFLDDGIIDCVNGPEWCFVDRDRYHLTRFRDEYYDEVDEAEFDEADYDEADYYEVDYDEVDYDEFDANGFINFDEINVKDFISSRDSPPPAA